MVNRIEIQHSKRTGSAIVIILMAMVIIALLGAAMLRVGLSSRVLAIRNCQAAEARCAADAGLPEALYRMNERLRNRTWSDSDPPGATNATVPGADATFSYTVSGNDATGYGVQSVGNRNQSQASVSATLRLKSLFDSAILVKDSISLMPNTLLSGYNSADPGDTDIDVKIGTTSILADRITLGPGSVVEGDVFVGVGGDPAAGIGAGGTINGRKFTLHEELEFPVITAPPLPSTGMALDAKGATITLGPADNGAYTYIALSQQGGSSGILEISGGDVVLHILGNIDMGTDCELIVRPGSSLTVYVDGDINANNSAGFNNEAGNVKDFSLYATGSAVQTFNMKAKSSIFGTIYAPDVDIEMYSGTEIHGAVVANKATFKSGCSFYYDEALRDVSVYDEGVRFEIKHWHDN